jgi:hypothetical protein
LKTLLPKFAADLVRRGLHDTKVPKTDVSWQLSDRSGTSTPAA